MSDSWRAHPLMCVLNPLPSQQGVVGSRAKRVMAWWRQNWFQRPRPHRVCAKGKVSRKKVPGEKLAQLQRLVLRIWIQMLRFQTTEITFAKKITATKLWVAGNKNHLEQSWRRMVGSLKVSCFKVIQLIANCNGKLGCPYIFPIETGWVPWVCVFVFWSVAGVVVRWQGCKGLSYVEVAFNEEWLYVSDSSKFNRGFHLPRSRLADGYTTGWCFQICSIFTPTWGNDPFWLINMFKWVGSTTN